jgi:N-acyl-D-aspartate/D-glutamate deacylase
MIYDLVIKNGTVICFQPDRLMENLNIGIVNGMIQTVTREVMIGKTVINAAGRIVSPGFIDFHSHVDGNVFSAERVLLQGATTTLGGERSFNGKTIRKIYESGFLINQGFFISHSFTLRRAAGIKDPYRGADAEEISSMMTLAEKFLDSGCFGIHFGLEFVPGTSQQEIIELARLAKRYERIVTVHLRKDGHEALDSLDEIIEIAEKTGASVHILHLMYMVGFEGIMERALKKIKDARSRGLDITADTGLYAAFPSYIGSSILDNDWEKHYGKDISEKNLMISSGINAGKFCDRASFEYLRENFPNTLITAFVCDESEIKRALCEDFVFVSTNAADGPHYENVGHPETAGTFPRLIHKYVREEECLDLVGAVKKITLAPAERFGIRKKGSLIEGYDADLVIFDAQSIKDRADYVSKGNPNEPPEGIDFVIVNGHIAVHGGMITKHRNAGRMIENLEGADMMNSL